MFIPKESAPIEIDWPVKASYTISVLSSQDILCRSGGEVISPESFDYDNNGNPIPTGIFCEKIFGRKETYRCSCSWFGIPLAQGAQINKKEIHRFEAHSGSTCRICGSLITPLKDRLTMFGHIKLAAPVIHIWFLKSELSKIGAVLDLTLKQLEKIIYFEQYVVIESNTASIPVCSLINEKQHQEYLDKFSGQFQVAIGADAIKILLARQDMVALSLRLREEMTTTLSKVKKQKLQERLFVIESLRDSGNRPECMVLEIIPVLPLDLRPYFSSGDGNFFTSDINDLYRRVINRNNRLKRLLELDAPDIIIRNEKRMLQEAVDALFDNGSRGRVITGPTNRRLASISDYLLITTNVTERFRDYSYIKNSCQTFLYASHKTNLPELFGVFLTLCLGLGLLFDLSDTEEIAKPVKLTTDPKTQCLLGHFFNSGLFVSKDFEEAIEWYTKSAEQGYSSAQSILGSMYYRGQDLEQDYEKAIKWCTKAATQGDIYAQFIIGRMYYFGQGVIQDYEKAADFYMKAAEQGNALAQAYLGKMYDLGEGLAQNLKKSVAWYTKAAEQGHAEAQNILGGCYLDGRGVQKNYKKAFDFFTNAAEQGVIAAQNNLGMMYSLGCGVKRDKNEAFKWITKAADQGYAIAQNNLGRIYLRGLCPEEKPGEILLRSIFGEISEDAVMWFTKAAEQGYSESQYNLGEIYAKNKGKSRENTKKAIEWYRKAADQGHEEARKKLDEISNIEN